MICYNLMKNKGFARNVTIKRVWLGSHRISIFHLYWFKRLYSSDDFHYVISYKNIFHRPVYFVSF